MHLLDLPPELILACLCDLPFLDLLNLLKVGNKQLHTLLRESVFIQYRAELESADVDENPLLQRLVIADRRAALLERESRWQRLKPLSRYTIRPGFTSSSIYDVVGDWYMVGDSPDPVYGLPTALRYIATSPAPSFNGETGLPEAAEWVRIASDKPIIDFVVSLASHDLLVMVTCTLDSVAELVSIDLEIRRFSTGTRHPLAPSSDIHVTTAPLELRRPSVSIEVVGKVLAISLMYWSADSTEHDYLYVFDWQLGERLMEPRPISNNGLTFLSHDLLVVSNTNNESLEILVVPETPPAAGASLPEPAVHSFFLPVLAPGQLFLSFHCRGHPNPDSPPTPYALPSKARFIPRAKDSIILFSFSTALTGAAGSQDHMFVLARWRFLTIVRAYLENHARKPTAAGVLVPWADWGPRCTRFLDASAISCRYITTTSGQRLVSIARGAHNLENGAPIRVLCFNEHVIHQYREFLSIHSEANVVESEHSVARLVEADDNDTSRDPSHGLTQAAIDVFQDPREIVSHLAYVEIVSKRDEFGFGVVVINDENIIGVKFSGTNQRTLESLEVLHFG